MPTSSKTKEDLLEWESEQEEVIPWISNIYKKRFKELAPLLFLTTQTEAKNANIPCLSQLEFMN